FTHRNTAGHHDLYENDSEVHRKGYLTDLISDRAVEFIGRKRKDPFLLSVHYNAPHWPWLTREDEVESKRIEKIYHFDGGSVVTYLTMIRQMDEGIGRILKALKSTRADHDTLVVFTSDNGGERFSDTWPLVGKKMDLLEGGIRVPYIVRWPAKIKSGGSTDQVAITMDWVVTFLDAANVKPHPDYPLDGVSLLSVLSNPSKAFERELYWKMLFRNQKALRSGDWKYLSVDGEEFLFNLAKDQRERANYANRDPKRLGAMRARYLAWEAALPKHPDATYSVPATKGALLTPSS
ncbi:MAG: sulfatase family protein, partial [Candidatus Rokuibacteriota bacterium]